jgi:TonB family protein
LKYLENELHKRKQLGKVATVAGISLGIAGTFAACNAPQQQANTPETVTETINIDTVSMDTIPAIPPVIDIIGDIPIPGGIIELEGIIGGRDWDDTTKLNDSTYIWQFVDIYPEFPGGEEARQKFLRDSTVYPKEAIDLNIEGTVMVQFVVEKDGSLTNFEIVRGVHPLLDEEVLRVVKMMPKWKPGEKLGKPVRVQYRMPFKFVLKDE